MWISVCLPRQSLLIHPKITISGLVNKIIALLYSKGISASTKTHASEKYRVIWEHFMIHCVLVRWLPSSSPRPGWAVESRPQPIKSGPGPWLLWSEDCGESSALGRLSPMIKWLLCSRSPEQLVRSPGHPAGETDHMQRPWEMRKRTEVSACKWMSHASSHESFYLKPQALWSGD